MTLKALLLGSVACLAASAASAQTVSVGIVDPVLVAGIESARLAFCAAQPQKDENGKDLACPVADASAYAQMVMEQAAASYARQFDVSREKKDAFLATIPEEKRAAVEAVLVSKEALDAAVAVKK